MFSHTAQGCQQLLLTAFLLLALPAVTAYGYITTSSQCSIPTESGFGFVTASMHSSSSLLVLTAYGFVNVRGKCCYLQSQTQPAVIASGFVTATSHCSLLAMSNTATAYCWWLRLHLADTSLHQQHPTLPVVTAYGFVTASSHNSSLAVSNTSSYKQYFWLVTFSRHCFSLVFSSSIGSNSWWFCYC